MAEEENKGESGSQKGQGETGDKAGQKGEEQKTNADGWTDEQQAKINSMLAEERRKESKKAEKIKKELEDLKTKGLSKDEQTEQRINQMEEKLKGYEAKELANSICADLKIPKEERERYIKYVTATDEDGIKEQLKRLKADFGPSRTGAGSNPARQGKPGKNDSINQFIRNRGKR
jgi:predicted phage gp36 major capsid-like protein